MRPGIDVDPVLRGFRRGFSVAHKRFIESAETAHTSEQQAPDTRAAIGVVQISDATGSLSCVSVLMQRMFFGAALLPLLFPVPTRAQDRATCESRATEIVHAYVKRTRDWVPGNYDTHALLSRAGNEQLAIYAITPDAQLRGSSLIAMPFEVYFDQEACKVVGEYTPPRRNAGNPDPSGEVQP